MTMWGGRLIRQGSWRPWVAACLLSALASNSWAGAQIEEPLANSVRTALSAAVSNSAPPVPVFMDAGQRGVFDRWVAGNEVRLIKRQPDQLVRREFLQTIWYEAKRAGLDPTLVLGLVEVESGFRKHAISSVGARGYMQVMPFWSRTIGDGDPGRLFHMQTNLRFGCVILRHYLNIEKGDLYLALGRYNGSRGRAEYPNAVFGAAKRWQEVGPAETRMADALPSVIPLLPPPPQIRAR